ncbi:MAG: ABC transporter permease [Pirellulales bacterium]|nr:ABC transporter permease [Pirellulales bacterium]
MRPIRIIAVARKEFLHVLRDVRSLGMAIAIPLLMLVLFGYALTLDVDDVPLAVWDQSETSQSRALTAAFDGSRYFTVRRYVRNYRELDRSIDTGEALGGLVIPRDYAQLLDAGRDAPVQLIVDGSDSNKATIALGYASMVVQNYAQQIVLQALKRRGVTNVNMPLDLRPRVEFNTDLQSKNFIVPGLIAVLMMVIAALMTSLTVAREWEQGTMEQLISTPVKGPELIVGKMIPYFVIAMIDVVVAVLMGQFLFQVPLRGSVVFLFAIAVVFLIGALSMGMLISINAKSQLLASQLAMVATFLPAFLLSGFMFSIDIMPPAIQAVTYVVPARYFVTILKAIYMKGVGLPLLLGEVVLLSIYALVMGSLAMARFKKKLT